MEVLSPITRTFSMNALSPITMTFAMNALGPITMTFLMTHTTMPMNRSPPVTVIPVSTRPSLWFRLQSPFERSQLFFQPLRLQVHRFHFFFHSVLYETFFISGSSPASTFFIM